MNVNSTADRTYLCVHIVGDMNADAADRLDSEFDFLQKGVENHLILDLSRVEFIDSAGVTSMLRLNMGIAEANRKLAICGARGQVYDYLQIMGILNLIPHYNSKEDMIITRH